LSYYKPLDFLTLVALKVVHSARLPYCNVVQQV
jgi:hypothetical protein